MADRRMFSRSVVQSDAFCALGIEEQNLYFHLSMDADDDGVIDNASRMTYSYGLKPSHLDNLVKARFILKVGEYYVIKHWKVNNYIQKDRYKSSKYGEVIAQLEVKENGSYTEKDKACIQETDSPVYRETVSRETQNSIGKVRLGKDSIGKDSIDICSEPETVSELPTITLPLNTGVEYPITEEQVNELANLYPSVDVLQELRNMRGWLLGNPTKRKTKTGIMRFVHAWLSKEQNKGGYVQQKPKEKSFLEMLEDET